MRFLTVLLLTLPTYVIAADPTLSLAITGGAHRLCTIGEDHPQALLSATGLTAAVTVTMTSRDLWNAPSTWTQIVQLVPDPAGAAQATIALPTEAGYQAVTAALGAVSATSDYGMVPKQAPGVRKQSFFASNTSNFKRGVDADFLRRLGMRVQRLHFNPRISVPPPASPAGALTLDFTEQDAALAELIAKDQWVLPIAGYAFDKTKSASAERTGMYGPPRDEEEFVATWEQILRHYPELDAIEFWNEPWIYGWTWSAPPAAYRSLQKRWCEMALRVSPKLRVIAGNSVMFVQDHIEPDPSCWKGLLQGTTHHPYNGPGDPTMRSGRQTRTIDDGMTVNQRMGLPFYYLTEGGTEHEVVGVGKNNPQNAFKVVQYTLHAALVGCFQSNCQWQIGYGPEWTKANTTFAVMTSFLEDRPVVADIWPHHELIWGAVFAHPRHVTPAVRALPRAAELSARWPVAVSPERAGDQTKVAVVWSNTGLDNDHVDAAGTLTIQKPGDIKAFDCTGRPIPARNGTLTVPFGEYPVYLVSEALDVVTFTAQINAARLDALTAVNCYAQCLARPADVDQMVTVRVENQVNRDLQATVRVTRSGQTPGAGTSTMLAAGRLVDVAVPWTASAPAADNQYGVTVEVTTPAGTVSRQQVLQVARFVKRTVPCDGTVDAFKDVPAVLLDSDRLKAGCDLSQYLLNPNLQRPTGTPEARRVVARVWAAYDQANIYLAASVDEDSFANNAGRPVKKGSEVLPYLSGTPDGLDHIRYSGDAFWMSFGFRDRVPGWGRQMSDPYAWKGMFYDSDEQFTAHPSVQGDQLIRQWGSDTSRRNGYQADKVPGCEPLGGGKVVIKRDESAKRTTYTIAIPRDAAPRFDPQAGTCRFAFALTEDQPVRQGLMLEWAEAAGVFDHWAGHGCFAPSWDQSLPCQTAWGIEP